jgi:tetratricopeptide (TPR) repeat protein
MRITLSTCLRLAVLVTTLVVISGGGSSYAQGTLRTPLPPNYTSSERLPKERGVERMSYSRATNSRVTNALDRAEAARLSSPPRYAEAEHAYRFAIYADPYDVRAYFGLGNLYAAQQRNTEAVQAYRKAVEVQPSSEAAHFNLGLMYLRLNNKGEALKQATILEKMKSPLAAKLKPRLGH